MASTINASNSGAGGLISAGDNSGVLALQTAGTTAITVDTSQNVGIGTTSPSYKLQVTQAGQTNAYIYNSTNAVGLRLIADSSVAIIQTQTNHPLDFAINNGATAMRIDTSGRWMVGTTTALNGGVARGSLLFNSTFEQGLFIATSVASNGQCMGFNYNTSTNVGSINITSSATSYSTSSDYRLKENITSISGALTKVAQLKPVNFKWKTDNSDGQGFIAHELAEVCPDAVTGTKDATREEQYEVTPAVKDEEGNITTPAVMGTRTVPAYQSVDTSFLVATLTAAIQELKAINDTQAETINALTARIVALEGK